MANVIYKINNCQKDFLQNHKFRYNEYLSEYDDEVYTYKFPLISNNKTATIECEISLLLTTGVVNVNVYNAGTKELYAPYYNREFGNYELLRTIDMKIDNKLKELWIEKILA